MCEYQYFTGIDIGKDKIDIFCTQNARHYSVPNKRDKIQSTMRRFDSGKTLVVLENTGGYENICVNTLEKLGFDVHKTVNHRVKSFLKYQGIKAKTDKVDAKSLAEYGKCAQKNGEELTIHTPETLEFTEAKQSTILISELKRIRTSLKNRLKSPGCSKVHESLLKIEKAITEEIAKLERRTDDLVQKDQQLLNRIQILQSYKGIGKVAARELALYMPELGKLSSKQVASLGGVAPYPRESGKNVGYRYVRGGRPMVKRILFMSILSAMRFNPQLSEFYQRKINQGKPKKIAMVACMRKCLIHLNARLASEPEGSRIQTKKNKDEKIKNIH